MGRKVNPRIFRITSTYKCQSRWFSQKNFAQFLEEDVKIRKYIRTKLKTGGVARVDIERGPENVKVIIHTSKPGIIIGRGGGGIEEIKNDLQKKFFVNRKIALNIVIQEVSKPDLSAELVMQNIIEQLEKRIPFRRAIKRAISSVMAAKALGIKVMVSGRLNGVSISRSELFVEGKIPLQTMRADIDYTRGAARTTYGAVGVKVWIYKGEVFAKDSKESATNQTGKI
ncbi:30S ribosomal protein S3 [Patescibacteria group bacterium]|nr:30S ribosomal protein S3 [Patescibacteria group bacterium]